MERSNNQDGGAAAASLRRLGVAIEGFAAQLQCAICLCAYANPSSLPCNHCFCEECIHRALELKAECPICKAPAKKRKLRFDSMISQLLRATDALSAPPAVDVAADAVAENKSASRERKQVTTLSSSDAATANDSLEEKAPASALKERTVPNKAKTKPKAKTQTKANGAKHTAAPVAEATAPASSETSALDGPFAIGQLVQVASRTWIGINKPGGAARITHANEDGTYNVKYVLDSRREAMIPVAFITQASDELAADVTPSRAVKQRQRRAAKAAASSEDQPLSSPMLEATVATSNNSNKRKRSDLVLLCSGYDDKRTNDIATWAATVGAEIVASWSNRVTHLVVKCVAAGTRVADSASVTAPPPTTRWVKIRSMKYLKALVGGRWIVSEDWLQACAAQGDHVSETAFEADGHLKGQTIDDAVRRSRKRRQANLVTSPPNVDPDTIGTELFAAFCFHLVGDFLPPMPPQSELDTLLRIGGAQRVQSLDAVAAALAACPTRRLVLVTDRINPVGLRDVAKTLRATPSLAAVENVAIVNYQWVLNSISEAQLQPLK